MPEHEGKKMRLLAGKCNSDEMPLTDTINAAKFMVFQHFDLSSARPK